MKKVIFETEEAVFQFDRKDVKKHLKFLEAEHGLENTHTRASQFKGLSAENSYQLQKVGGNILGMLN